MMDVADELEGDASGVWAKVEKGRLRANNVRNL
jgi:hypothetical protein